MDALGSTANRLLPILDVTRHLVEQRMLYPLLEYVAAVVFELIAAERCLIVLFGDGDALDVQIARTRQGDLIASPQEQISRSILRHACATMTPLVVNDAPNDHTFKHARSVHSLGIRSVLCVPLVACERSIGAIYVENRSGQAIFRDDHLLPLVLFSHQVVAAIENAKVHESLSRANARLARALQIKDEFLTMISHELRTPLSIILGVTEGMAEDLYGPLSAEQRPALATAISSGRQLLRLISDLLDLSRIVAGDVAISWQPIDTAITCQLALQSAEAAARQKNIRLICEAHPAIAGLLADEHRLIQILSILLDNAVKFTPPGGTVRMEVLADAAHECVHFAVSDTGIGIATADFDLIFQPFAQADGGLTRAHGGAGLGLTLVRWLVDLHGGSVRLESEPGCGSRFTVSLPWPIAAAPPQAALSGALHAEAWPQMPHIVIADDHEISLRSCADLLSQRGYQVSAVRLAGDLLAVARAARPALLVLDLQMCGLEGIAAIGGDPALAGTPIIVLTALTFPGDRERCLAAGAMGYLPRPASPRALAAAVADLLPPAAGAPAPGAG